MDADAVVETLPIATWDGPFSPVLQRQALTALEHGKVVLLPDLPFRTTPDEAPLLRPNVAGCLRKNISLDPHTGKLGNATLNPVAATQLAAMMQRFATQSLQLLHGLLPAYAATLEQARTSFRPSEVAGREYSPRQDDRRLHVDAFPSRPLGGRRILRVFSNVAPDNAARVWRVGEEFETFAERFLPRAKRALPGSAWLLERAGITKGRRTNYDSLMLRLHDGAKLDAAYQAASPFMEMAFPPGAVWMCFTDQVLHAVLAGHCALEQTFYVPVEAMTDTGRAPLRVLERLVGRPLT
jgi:hypothetical protein